ncbi:MAG: 1-(5-phosphoribosyl)-5-[(5-phosphoribosylamino)methylideneamino]imidazole-4-carboxamide isomerase [Polyangiales bacterium]
MELIPAIDVLGGKVVRLHKGRYDEATVYADDPAQVASGFREQGARRVHVVDLDGARDGRPRNMDAIRRILERGGVAVQVGGGIRDLETARAWLDAGADRVVLGTAAVKDPTFPRTLAGEHEGAVVVAIDAREGRVAVEGWVETSERQASDLAREVDGWGVAAILYTNIDRDGTRSGPDVEGTAALQRLVDATVIASGGIGDVEHVRALSRAGVRAAVCGRALYTGALDLTEAFAAAARSNGEGEG